VWVADTVCEVFLQRSIETYSFPSGNGAAITTRFSHARQIPLTAPALRAKLIVSFSVRLPFRLDEMVGPWLH
jgi:hypothetical protein